MKNIIHILISLVLLTALSLLSCDDTITQSQDIVFPSENVSYSKHVQPLFNITCTGSGCHNDQDREASLSLTTWANTTASTDIVFPFLPDNSKLVWAIEGQGFQLMPPVGSPYRPLNENQREGIKTWIREGAENN